MHVYCINMVQCLYCCCSLCVPWYNICIVLQIDQWDISLLFLTIHAPVQVIFRSYRYTFFKTRITLILIPSLVTFENWPSVKVGRLVIWRPLCLRVSNSFVDKIFLMFTCSVFLSARLAAFKCNQGWYSSEVIGAHADRKIFLKMAAK